VERALGKSLQRPLTLSRRLEVSLSFRKEQAHELLTRRAIVSKSLAFYCIDFLFVRKPYWHNYGCLYFL